MNDEQERTQMLHALNLADSALTWCRARHKQGSADNAAVLEEAIHAVLAFTRPDREARDG